MKHTILKTLIGPVALAGLHLSCAASDDSNWERPRIMPARSSWETRTSYSRPVALAEPVQRAAEQSSYQVPQNQGYTPAGGDAFPPLPAAEPPPPAPRPGFASGVRPGELPAVAQSRTQGRPWKQTADQVAARLQEPDLRTELQKRLDEMVPAVARALMDRPTEDAIVTVAVYREAGGGAGDGAAPTTQPGKQVAIAVAFEGFGREADDTFLPRVLTDMPRPSAERQALAAAATRPTTQPGADPPGADPAAAPTTQPAPPNLVLDADASGYMVFFLGDEGLTSAFVPHREMKRNVVAALTTGAGAPATGPADAVAGATQPGTQPTPEELADMARRELELREREMEQWRNWYDADRERYERELAERDLYEQRREAQYEARRQYDRGYDDGLYAASDYGWGYGHGYYYPRWHHYRWSHYRYCPGWYYSPTLIVVGAHRHHYHRHWNRGHWEHHDKDHHDRHRGGWADRGNQRDRNFGLPSSNLPAASTGRVPWGSPPPASPSGTLSGVLPHGGTADRTSPDWRPSAVRTSPRGDGVFANPGGQDRQRNNIRADRNSSRAGSGRLNVAPSSIAPAEPPVHGPQPFDRTATPAPAPTPRGEASPAESSRRRAAPAPRERTDPRGAPERIAAPPPPNRSAPPPPNRSGPSPRSSSPGRSFTPSPSPSPSRAAPSRGGGGGGGRSSSVSPARSSPRGDSSPSRGGGGGAGGSSRGGGGGGGSRGGSDSGRSGPRGS